MCGESMISDRDFCFEVEYFHRLFKKLFEDVEEAYFRTPIHVSSRPYIERMYRLIQAGLSESRLLMEECYKSSK
ncbi:hypothetical protein PYJP_14640 [Pyrofollis japonicus]|nr:hypothetical protein PYJP_14640 [Pyrofollis japonicus]